MNWGGSRDGAGEPVSLDGVSIRSDFRVGDLGAIVRMHGALYHEEYGFNRAFEAYVANGLAEFALEYDPARSRLWVAERGGEIVGSIALVGRGDGATQIRWFLVHPYVRHMGVGRKLLAEALAFARSSGARSCFLWTFDELEAAIRLYRMAGFQLTEKTARTGWGRPVTEERYELAL